MRHISTAHAKQMLALAVDTRAGDVEQGWMVDAEVCPGSRQCVHRITVGKQGDCFQLEGLSKTIP